MMMDDGDGCAWSERSERGVAAVVAVGRPRGGAAFGAKNRRTDLLLFYLTFSLFRMSRASN